MRLLNLVFALALLSVPAFAALSLQSFSCNSQSGTVTVENGASFNCQAAIKNDGSTTTNITSVSLSVPSPVWAESASYTGTGYSSSVQAGATTTATFSGIKAVLSGAHNFNTVTATPSGALDADVTSTNINVVSIKTVELSKPASAASGEQFSAGATVTVGGTLSVTATISSISGGCSLVSGETSAKSLGIMNNDVPSATSWALTQGSGDCSFTVTASSGAYTPKSSSGTVLSGSDVTAPIISSVSASSITTSSAVITWSTNEDSTSQVEYGPTASYGSSTTLDSTRVRSHSVSLSGLSAGTAYYYRAKSSDAAGNPATSGGSTFTTTSSSSGGTTGGGGGGGAGGAAVAAGAVKETKTIASVEPGIPAVINISKSELSVSEIRIDALAKSANVSVSVEKLDSRPASIAASPTADGKVYKYLDISSNLGAAGISKVKLKFKVENTWISSNNFSTSTVYLNRYSNGWSKLPTVFLSRDSSYSYFESDSPGFSTFAITGEKPAAAAPAPVEQPKPPAEEVPVAPTPTGLAPTVTLVSQSDIDSLLQSLNSVVPQTDAARSLLEQARGKIAEAQAAFNSNEQAKAKQLLDEARALIDEAAGLKSAAVAAGKRSIYTILLVLVVLVVGVYAYYARPASRGGAGELAKLKKERDTIRQMKKNAEKEYLSRKIDKSSYESMLAKYEGDLVEVNTRIDELSKKNN